MRRSRPLEGIERYLLVERLQQRYGDPSSLRARWLYFRKKYSWLFVITFAKWLKRALDLIGSLLLLILLSPLFLILALLIKLQDWGPIIYKSHRVGKWGHEFICYKFRTMGIGAEQDKELLRSLNMHQEPGTFKIKEDPRITPIGKFLRRTSLDELPQLVNVLKGEMSLVGPRPPLPDEVALYTLDQRRRLDVIPGLTCIWQVSGRSNIPFSGQVKLDKEYIESQSLWLDFILLLKTIPSVILGKGAY